MSRAGVVAALLLGCGVSPVLLTSSPAWTAPTAPGAVVLPLAPDMAPDLAPAQPTEPTGPAPTEGSSADIRSGGEQATDGASPGADTDESGTDGESLAGDPLQVTVTRLSPSTLPRQGRVSLAGRITNLSDDDWSDLTVYAATSATPITTPEELLVDEAGPSGVEPADYQRLVDPDLYTRVGSLGPGDNVRYRLSIPRSKLGVPAAPGVYRVGVQVLGTENGAREDGADGRTRVLMASVPPGRDTPFSLALQMRKRTVRTAEGAVDYVTGWQRTLGRQGRLRQVVRLLSTAGDYPLSVVVDPAVVEAVGSLAAGNDGFALTQTSVDGLDPETGTLIADPPPTSEPGEPASSEASEQLTPTEGRTAAHAIAWLQQLGAALEGRDVRAVPYGDLDLGAAARHGRPDLVARSLATGLSLLSEYGIQATGIAAPYHGLLGQETADALPDGVPMLVSRRSFTAAVVDGGDVELLDTPAPVVPPVLAGVDTTPIWTFRSLRSEPGSAAGVSALEMRQRILARSGVQALTRPGAPVVVALPPQWNPGPAWARSDFFAGLRAPWLRPVLLDQVPPDETPVVEGRRPSGDADGAEGAEATPAPDLDTEGEATTALALSYPERQLDSEVPVRVFRAARRLSASGTVLGSIIVTDSDAVGPRLERQAMLGLSVHTRGRAPGVTGRMRAADNIVTALLRDVEVLAPRFVRMASASGSFLVPVVNQLDVPIRVQLRPVVAEPGLLLEVPEPVEVPARSRQPVRVAVTAETIGIRSVRVDLVTASGERLYPGPRFSVRSSQVARWVWVVMAVGSVLLFVAITVRITRRVRARAASRPAASDPTRDDP